MLVSVTEDYDGLKYVHVDCTKFNSDDSNTEDLLEELVKQDNKDNLDTNIDISIKE